jgi:hypothetical protein
VVGINVNETLPSEVPAFRRHFGIDHSMPNDDGGVQ